MIKCVFLDPGGRTGPGQLRGEAQTAPPMWASDPPGETPQVREGVGTPKGWAGPATGSAPLPRQELRVVVDTSQHGQRRDTLHSV